MLKLNNSFFVSFLPPFLQNKKSIPIILKNLWHTTRLNPRHSNAYFQHVSQNNCSIGKLPFKTMWLLENKLFNLFVTVTQTQGQARWAFLVMFKVGLFWKQELTWLKRTWLEFLLQSAGFQADNMCTGKCSLFIAISLYPLVLLSILCNILLFFPDWSTKYVKEEHITNEVKYMGGFIGGGVLVSSWLVNETPNGKMF